MNDLIISKLEQCKNLLTQCRDIETTKKLIDMACAAQIYAKRQKLSQDAIDSAHEIKIEAMRLLGDFLRTSEKNVGAKGSIVTPSKKVVLKDTTPTLSDLGISYKESSKSQFLADIAENSPEKFDLIKRNEKSIHEIRKDIKREAVENERKNLAENGKNKEIDIDLRLGDFEEVFSDIEEGSVDCIITDPPYPFEFIECWSKLSRFAKKILKPYGFCIAYSGQMYLPEVIKRMTENLDYYWTFAVYHEGQTRIINGVNLINRWKPVLIFQKGRKKISNTIQDYFISENREKNGHDWQQSKSGVSFLIENFTHPYQLVLDPFAGAGTFLIIAKEKNRIVKGAEINNQTFNIARALL